MGKQVYFKELRALNKKIKEEIKSNTMNYNAEDMNIVTSLGYYSKLIEGIQSIIDLVNKNRSESVINIIARNIIECSIDIYNLKHQENYIYYLVYLSENAKRLLEGNTEYKRLKNKGIKIKRMVNECKVRRDRVETFLDEKYFDKNKNVKTSVAFKFNIADKMDIYDSVYWLFSNDVHNNLNSIEGVYINKDFKVSVFKPLGNEFIEHLGVTLLIILIEASRIVFGKLESKHKEILDYINSVEYKIYNDIQNNNLTFEL